MIYHYLRHQITFKNETTGYALNSGLFCNFFYYFSTLNREINSLTSPRTSKRAALWSRVAMRCWSSWGGPSCAEPSHDQLVQIQKMQLMST